jgi:hypothetical protein
MMPAQHDFFGGQVELSQQFKDIANQRPTVAERKACLTLELGRLCQRIPTAIKTGGSVNVVREWRAVVAIGQKIASNRRSSIAEITAATSNLRRLFGDEK